jgi:hypothetical protein
MLARPPKTTPKRRARNGSSEMTGPQPRCSAN